MLQETGIRFRVGSAIVLLTLAACSAETQPESQEATGQDRNLEETQGIVLLRGLPTLGTSHGVAIVELDPEAENFGEILQQFEFTGYEAPLHHLYYSPNGRLYATGLDPECSLAEIDLSRDSTGNPVINGVDCLDTKGQQVGEDIMWHSVNDRQYMFVTFMGGTGVDQADGGSIGVFDPQSNEVVKIIEARKSMVGEGEPYIMYPHGISAYGDRMVVSSTIHPDLATGVGNAVTVIDLNTFEPIENIVIEDAKPVGFPSSPVEVLFVRPSISERATPSLLVTTMFGFEVWRLPFDEETKSIFNRKREMPAALGQVVADVNAEVLVLSYNDESWIALEDLVDMCAPRGEVAVLSFDSKRYVGAQIGVHNPRGERVGEVGRLRNVEYLLVAGPGELVARATEHAGAARPHEMTVP